MAGEVQTQTFVQLIKFSSYRQFSVPKPPLLLAANRYLQPDAHCSITHSRNSNVTITALKYF